MSSQITHPETRALATLAEKQGWLVDAEGGRHIDFHSPDGAKVTVARTPSDWRAHRNNVAELRRHGLDIPRKTQKPKKQPDAEMTNALVQAEIRGLDLSIPEFPFITAVLGQWRSPSWFSEEGFPLTEEQWRLYDDENLMAMTLMVDALNSVNPSNPSARQKRTWFDTIKFWRMGCDKPIIQCCCGFAPGDQNPYRRMFLLAEHIYGKFERGDNEHRPLSVELLDYTDPSDLVDLVAGDDTIGELEKLQSQLAECQARFREEREAHAALREKLRGLL